MQPCRAQGTYQDMQTLSAGFWGWQWAFAVLGIGAQAAAAMPVITALTLCMERHGQSALRIQGAYALTRLNIWLACLGPLLVTGDALLLLSGSGGTGALWAASLTNPAFLPYTTSVASWLAGIFCLLLYARKRSIPPLPQRTAQCGKARTDDALRHAQPGLRQSLVFVCLAALCFFAARALPYWPFASLPQGMDFSRAATAVLSGAAHNFFAALSPAGAIALLALPVVRSLLPHTPSAGANEQTAARWCALWALAGYVPRCLDRWGVLLGFALREGALPDWLALQALAQTFLTLAIACWGILFGMRAPRRLYWLNGLALGLLAARESLPFLARLF